MNRKQKNIFLVLGFLAGLIICYHFAFAKTFETKEQLNNLERQKAIFEDLPRNLSILKQKEKYYDSILSKYQLRESSLQNNLLKELNQFANENELLVINFKEPHRFLQNELMSTTYQFTIQGNYNSIIKLIHRLEQKTKFGEIINLHFTKKRNYRTNSFYLQAEVLIRNFSEK